VVAGTCLWEYRKGECGYAGGPVADYADNPTSDPAKDQCSLTMRGCKKRFGANGELPFGGFPGSARVPRF
jgi:lambda family phage minor tail protein L